MDLIRTPKIEKVKMLDRFNSKKPNVGTLHLTATHLIFIDPERKKEAWILHTHIASVVKLAISAQGSPLQIRCKNFLSVTFVIPKERDSHDIYMSLLKLSQPTSVQDLYCFHYTASNEDQPKRSGWNKFDLQAEFARMGVPNDKWHLTTINRDYEICDTYPRLLYVPASSSTAILVGSSRFRSRGRLPVLSYLHKNMAAICRCSQPLSGFSARCPEDERLLDCILKSSPNGEYMYVVDTRPKINAMANRAAGKGYENEDFYRNIKFQFFGIENIHVMRSSLQKMVDVCELKVPTMGAFLSGLESSGWLRHVKTVLEASAFIAEALENGTSVLVHCSDGWDRTAQTCSLAALLQDPYYRTITGFQALLEKEWLSFGHKFTDRCGLVQGDPKEAAPVFTQFVDAVWQLTHQFPSSFQFNERFLLTVHDHVHSCQFGTFVGNCEKERADLRLSERTYSLWGYMSNHLSEFLNPLYRREVDRVLHPSPAPQAIQFWRGMYNRFEDGVHPREPLGDMLVAAKDHISSLEDHALFLQKRIGRLKRALGHTETPTEERASLARGDAENGLLEPGSPSLSSEVESVAIEWRTLRNVKECICSTPFDHFRRKFHCWSCGDVFCIRCIDKRLPLRGHGHGRPVPVCRHCYRELRRTDSVDS